VYGRTAVRPAARSPSPALRERGTQGVRAKRRACRFALALGKIAPASKTSCRTVVPLLAHPQPLSHAVGEGCTGAQRCALPRVPPLPPCGRGGHLKGVGFFRGCGNLPLKYTEKIYPRTNKHKNHHHQAPSQPYTTPKKTPTTHSQHPNTRPTPHAPTPNHAAAHTQDTHQPRPTSHRRRTLTQPILTDQPP